MPARRITKVLIANRGEIACRVIRACRELDLRTVAVHSEADAAALHVRWPTRRSRSGRRPRARATCAPRRSSTRSSSTGADAVHPGYGFLSENADFAEAVRGRGRDVHRAAARGDPRHGRQDLGARADAGGRRAGRPRRQRRGRARVRHRRQPRRRPPRASAIRSCSRRRRAAAGAACAWSTARTSWRPRSRARSARPRRRSATTPSTSRRRSSGRATSRSRSSATSTAAPCTSTSATARSSGATRR